MGGLVHPDDPGAATVPRPPGRSSRALFSCSEGLLPGVLSLDARGSAFPRVPAPTGITLSPCWGCRAGPLQGLLVRGSWCGRGLAGVVGSGWPYTRAATTAVVHSGGPSPRDAELPWPLRPGRRKCFTLISNHRRFHFLIFVAQPSPGSPVSMSVASLLLSGAGAAGGVRDGARTRARAGGVPATVPAPSQMALGAESEPGGAGLVWSSSRASGQSGPQSGGAGLSWVPRGALLSRWELWPFTEEGQAWRPAHLGSPSGDRVGRLRGLWERPCLSWRSASCSQHRLPGSGWPVGTQCSRSRCCQLLGQGLWAPRASLPVPPPPPTSGSSHPTAGGTALGRPQKGLLSDSDLLAEFASPGERE